MVTSHKMGNFQDLILSLSSKKPVQKRNPGDYSHPISKDIKEFFENLHFQAKLFCILYMSLKLHNQYRYSLDLKYIPTHLGALHLYLFLAVGSWIMWFISSWDKNNFCKLSKLISFQSIIILSENSCHFVNLFSF